MMHQGGIVLDKAGEEKQAVQMDDITLDRVLASSAATEDRKAALPFRGRRFAFGSYCIWLNSIFSRLGP